MKNFSLNYKDISLNIECDDYIELLITNHLLNHIIVLEPQTIPTFTLVIKDKIKSVKGIPFKMVDKWFDNATLDCYIDNKNNICYATNFNASTKEYKDLLIQYFVANLFNRFLEIEGYYGLHSSCVEKDGNGVVFSAGRNSGKTVCMLNMMDAGFNCVTNDKSALKNNNDNISCYGIAQSVSVRLSPEFCKQPQNQKYVELANKRGISIKEKNMLEGNNIVLNDTELAKLNNVKQVIDTDVRCIIRPFYDPNIKKPVIRELTREQLYELLVSQYMPLVHDTTDFFRVIAENEEIDKKVALNQLLNLPAYSYCQNEFTTDYFVEDIKKLVRKR